MMCSRETRPEWGLKSAVFPTEQMFLKLREIHLATEFRISENPWEAREVVVEDDRALLPKP